MAALDEVGTFLVSKGVGVLGTSLFLGRLPSSPTDPNDAMAVLQYPGRSPELHLGASGIQIEFPRFQFVSRASTIATALSKAQTAYAAVADAGGQTISGTRYAAMTALSSPGLLRYDENARPIVVFNFEVEKSPS